MLEEVWKDGEMKAQYNYLADGTKLGVRDGSGKTGYDYVGSMVYKVVDGQREFDRAVVGDVHFTSEGIRYALTDQLGSVRALIDEDGLLSITSWTYLICLFEKKISYCHR